MFLHLKSSGASIGITRTFRESRFFVAFLLALSFILYYVMFDIVLLIPGLKWMGTNQYFALFMEITYNMCFIFDSVIYMSMDKDIKKLLREIFRGNRANTVAPTGRITVQNAGQPAVIYNESNL